MKEMLFKGNIYRIIKEIPKRIFFRNILLSILSGIMPLLFLFLVKLIIDRLGNSDFNRVLDSWRVGFLLGLAAIIYFGQNALAGIAGLAREKMGYILGERMYGRLHQHSIKIKLETIEDPACQDQYHRAVRDITFRPQRITAGIMQLAQSTVSLVLLVGLFFYIHWIIALVLFIASLPLVWVRIKYARRHHNLLKDETTNERQASYYHRILTGDAFARELRLFRLGEYFDELFSKANREINNKRVTISKRLLRMELFAQAFAVILVFGTLLYICLLCIDGSISLGSVVLYFLAFQRGMSFSRDATSAVSGIFENRLFLDDLFSFFNLNIDDDNKQNVCYSISLNSPPSVSFENVSFIYPGQRLPSLEMVSFHIPGGRHFALVGENGAGKSTLVRLLCGLYKPASGIIRINGDDISQIPETEFNRMISVMFQDFVLYYMSAGKNIWFGDVSKAYDENALSHAAMQSGASELISGFPLAFETPLGRIMEDGKQLSIGEWQKIALARTFFKDAPILVLDEPGSSLDAKAESLLMSRMNELTSGKTSLIISHRLSATRYADGILVLDKGHLTEMGNHSELMDKNGLYASMFKLQANGYIDNY